MRRLINLFKLSLLGFTIAPLILTSSALACTRAMHVNDQAVVVGRTMDWQGDMKSNIWVFPRGIEHDGLAEVNSMNWTSKYGSIATMAYDSIATDGLNEKGFAAHIFWLIESDYGVRNASLPGISVLLWEQFYLDNFATVDEAVRYTQAHPFQLEPFELEIGMTIHLLLEDATGDSAVLEYIDGQLHIHHDRSYTVVTNSPSFDKQLVNLRSYKGFGGDKPLPGSTDSMDRFVRAAFYTARLPQATTSHEAIMQILSVTSNTAMPSGASSIERPEPSQTIWHTGLDLTHRVYYFLSTSTHNLIWADLDEFNLKAGAPILKLNIAQHPELSGNVTKEFAAGMMLNNPKSFRMKP